MRLSNLFSRYTTPTLNILLFVITLLTAVLLWKALLPTHQAEVLAPDDYEAFAIDIVSTKYSDQGTKRYELSSPRLNHYKHDNQTHVDEPVLHLYNPHQESWQVTAQYATAHQGKSIIEFINNVNISGAGTRNHQNTQLLTEKMTYYPDNNSAHTPLPVTIIQPGSLIHATGMNVAFNAGTINLLSKIYGSYDPAISS